MSDTPKQTNIAIKVGDHSVVITYHRAKDLPKALAAAERLVAQLGAHTPPKTALGFTSDAAADVELAD